MRSQTSWARNRFTPSDTIFDGPIAIVIDPRQPPYRPGNYDRKFRGIVTLRVALEHSINVPTVRLAQLVGLRAQHVDGLVDATAPGVGDPEGFRSSGL